MNYTQPLWIHFRFRIKLLCLHDKNISKLQQWVFPRCHNHHICFKACFGRFLMKDFQTFLSLVMSLLTHFPFFQITSDYLISCFSWSSSGETAANLEVLHLLDQALSSILSRCPKHCNLLSCKNSILLFNFSRVPSSFVEILSSNLSCTSI